MDVVLQVKHATTGFVLHVRMDDRVVTVSVVRLVNLVSMGSASINVLRDNQYAVVDVVPVHKRVVTVSVFLQITFVVVITGVYLVENAVVFLALVNKFFVVPRMVVVA